MAGWGGWAAEPVLEGLLEPLDLALGLGVARVCRSSAVTPRRRSSCLEAVAAAPAAGESRREDQAVVGQRRGRDAVGSDGGAEGRHHDRAGDPAGAAVTGSAYREWSSSQDKISVSVPSASG